MSVLSCPPLTVSFFLCCLERRWLKKRISFPKFTHITTKKLISCVNLTKISDTMSSIQSKPWDDKGWGSLFKRDFTSVATYGNNRSTRIVLISGQATIDREYVETTLKQNEQMNKITFQVMDILEENMCDINGLVLTD